MDLKATVISGEAPESDDDLASIATGMEFPALKSPNYRGTIISGEAPESDDDETSLSSVSGAIDAMACAPYAISKVPKSKRCSVKYNSLLHKKLRDCNKTLDSDLLQTAEGTVNAAVQELSLVNRQLLKSELILQEVVCQLQSASKRAKSTTEILDQLIDANFLHSVRM